MESEQPFLLSTSVIFNDANLIDCIRQSCIDLNEDTPEELVIDLIQEAIDYLSKDIPYDVANELIALIFKCFSCLTTDPLSNLKILFAKSKLNSYLLISFVSVLSYLANNNSSLDLSEFNSFVDEALKEIQPQIQNKSSLILFNLEIPFQFRTDLIFDLLLTVKPSDEILTDFGKFCFSDNIRDNDKFKTFYSKYSDAGFGTSLLVLLIVNRSSNKESIDFIDDMEKIQKAPKEFNETDEIDFITEFLSNPEPENDSSLKKSFFNKMLTEKVNLLGYFQIIFENLPNAATEPIDLIGYFNNEYELSKENFVRILDNVLVLHPTEKVFIRQPKYKPLNLPDSEFNKKILNQLYSAVSKDPGNFQAFYCLEFIANSFPFIFESNPNEVFEIVLPAFNNFKLIFENKKDHDDDDENKSNIRIGKASASAVTFLQFTLNSTKVFDSFINWFFENYKNLTLSQLMCIFFVIISPSTTNILNKIIAQFKKHDIFKAINDIMVRKVPKNLFGENFNYILYSFLIIQHKLEKALSILETISIDAFVKKDNIFYETSCGRITHSIDSIKPMKANILYLDKNDMLHMNTEIFDFIEQNKEFKPSYLLKGRTKNSNISTKTIDEFLQLYKSLIQPKEAAEDSDLPEITTKIHVGKCRSLVTKEPWIIQYLLQDKKFPLLSEHHKILSEVISSILHDDDDDYNDYDEDDSESIKDFDKEKYFRSYRESTECLKNFLERMSFTMYNPISQMSKYFKSIPFNKGDYEVVLKTIGNNIKEIEKNRLYYEQSTYIDIRSNIMLLARFAENQQKLRSVDDEEFADAFFKIIGNELVNFTLKPQSRQNKLILRIVYQLLSLLKKYPIRVLQIIGFMILANDKYLKKSASKLCLRFDSEELENLQLLDDFFFNEIISENPSITFISNILQSSKSLGKAHRKELLDILSTSLEKLEKNKEEEEEKEEEEKEEEDDDDEKEVVKLKDFVIQLLDFLSPDRDENCSFGLSDSLIAKKHPHDERFRFCPIPDFIYETSPPFWSVFEAHRPLINDILLKEFQENDMPEVPGLIGLLLSLVTTQFSSRLVSNFSECFSFDFRSTFFHQLVHKDLNFLEDLELELNQDNIFKESFEKLHELDPETWLQRIKISYLGNEGIDAGGLTKDWLTKLSNELFNPQSDIFEVSYKNSNFMPSRSQYAKSKEGLEKLKFAGMIIARALMQSFLVPVHFTKSFLKQILHHESKITLNDLEDADEFLFNSMIFYKEADFDKESDMDVRFEANDSKGDSIELIENGSQINVNNQNKEKYIELTTKFRLIESIKDQVKAFCEGFDSLIPHEKIRMFTPTELSLLICGVPKIDIDDLERNIAYKEPFNAETAVVKLFFETIRKWDDENLAKLLVFITGTSRMPANGFIFFKQIDSPITIVNGGDPSRLPCAHTCTNTLELPLYETEEELNSKLLTAINVNDFQIK